MKNLDATLLLAAALLVLFSTMWEAETTLIVSLVSLVMLSAYYSLVRERRERT